MQLYNVIEKESYGVIKQVKKLDHKEYEVIGELYIIKKIHNCRPDLISYDKKTHIAVTDKPKELQQYVNCFKGLEQYEFIFYYK